MRSLNINSRLLAERRRRLPLSLSPLLLLFFFLLLSSIFFSEEVVVVVVTGFQTMRTVQLSSQQRQQRKRSNSNNIIAGIIRKGHYLSFQTTTTTTTAFGGGGGYLVALQSSPNNNDDNSNNNDQEPSSSSTSSGGTDGGDGQKQQPSRGGQNSNNIQPRVYPQRWVQLLYLSLLALLSDWICFSVAAAPDTYEMAYSHSAASLIDLFLFTNVASCFLVTDVVDRIGLKRAIQGSALLMTVGCWLRAGLGFVGVGVGTAAAAASSSSTGPLVSYPWIVLGTVLVGAAQPFFQCTPPLLSATWFAASERATSTAVALNFNQIGIAVAFLVGGAMAVDVTGLSQYFGLIAITCTLVTAGTLLQFQEEPPIPPSASELAKKLSGEKEPPFIESVQRFFRKRGFTNALAAFVCSISITNIVGAFIDEIMERGGITQQLYIDLAGAGFELAILMGGIIIGGYVDKTKDYKRVTLACLAATAITVIPLGLTEHAMGKEPVLLLLSLLGLGMSAGPVQPINAELAVDVTYPGDETAVESVQQIGGNMISALLIPVAELASKRDFQLLPNVPFLESDVRGDVLLLLFLALVTMVYFNTFDAPLARTLADGPDIGEEDDNGSMSIGSRNHNDGTTALPVEEDATTRTSPVGTNTSGRGR